VRAEDEELPRIEGPGGAIVQIARAAIGGSDPCVSTRSGPPRTWPSAAQR